MPDRSRSSDTCPEELIARPGSCSCPPASRIQEPDIQVATRNSQLTSRIQVAAAHPADPITIGWREDEGENEGITGEKDEEEDRRRVAVASHRPGPPPPLVLESPRPLTFRFRR